MYYRTTIKRYMYRIYLGMIYGTGIFGPAVKDASSEEKIKVSC